MLVQERAQVPEPALLLPVEVVVAEPVLLLSEQEPVRVVAELVPSRRLLRHRQRVSAESIRRRHLSESMAQDAAALVRIHLLELLGIAPVVGIRRRRL